MQPECNSHVNFYPKIVKQVKWNYFYLRSAYVKLKIRLIDVQTRRKGRETGKIILLLCYVDSNNHELGTYAIT